MDVILYIIALVARFYLSSSCCVGGVVVRNETLRWDVTELLRHSDPKASGATVGSMCYDASRPTVAGRTRQRVEPKKKQRRDNFSTDRNRRLFEMGVLRPAEEQVGVVACDDV